MGQRRVEEKGRDLGDRRERVEGGLGEREAV